MEDVAEAQQPNSSSNISYFFCVSGRFQCRRHGRKKPLGWFSEIEADTRDSICAVSVLGGADAGLRTSPC